LNEKKKERRSRDRNCYYPGLAFKNVFHGSSHLIMWKEGGVGGEEKRKEN